MFARYLNMSSITRTFCITCYECKKSFKSFRVFSKHFKERHTDCELQARKVKFFDQEDIMDTPVLKVLQHTAINGYLMWLTGVTHQINASLHPCFPGKNIVWQFALINSNYD